MATRAEPVGLHSGHGAVPAILTSAHDQGLVRLRAAPLLERARARCAAGPKPFFSGLPGSAAPFVLGLLLEELRGPAIVVLQDGDDLESFAEELKVWVRQRDVLPYPYVPPAAGALEHGDLLRQMKSLRAMLENDRARGVWVTTLAALAAPCFALDFADAPALILEPGGRLKLEEITAHLEKRGFHREEQVEQKGDYAVRGGILDIFPRFGTHPVRVELWGDEIETLREFSLLTQRSIRALTRFVLDDLDLEDARHLRRDAALLDYLPESPLFLVQEPELAGREAGGRIPADSWALRLVRTEEDAPLVVTGARCAFFAASFEAADFDFKGRLLDPQGLSLEEAARFLGEQAINAETFLLGDYGSRLKLKNLAAGQLWLLDGPLTANFALDALGARVFHERHLVQLAENEVQDRRAVLADFVDFEIGDYIVHEEYGIGQFLGLSALERGGVTGDFLLLQFAGGTKVYVSVSEIHKVQKFIGRDEAAPELSRLGAKGWEMKKKRARAAIEKIVMELVRRQAFRKENPGFGFSLDTRDQRLFERAFPYQETPCQGQAWTRIKRDMEAPQPMDHLLCGDVGFGKTEIAVRAAHKAVLDHKQVAVLVPTTLLAEQHWRTFRERFGEKAGVIGLVSRFHTTGENARTLARLASGELLVLIGTHRLLSRDVEFADLGLLILDEEQRFGVKQKEALKSKYPAVDVLSLSATPIPRTLHMSLLGIRNISNLTLPPENRLPIRTYVREFSRGIVQHAIERELTRGGQAYFLHNHISDIEQRRALLSELFPGARLAVGHGQLHEHELAEVLQRFYAREVDILLSTAIIANGLDIPSANTMIIDNAHLFGLSELHQIRGRIGRYNLQAYAYLLVPAGTSISKESLRRLRAVEEHQELGSGFKLAMKDMEIRGVGNLLGEDQHGHIAEIGYELYSQYLSQAMAEARGTPGVEHLDVEMVWSTGTMYLPHGYIASSRERINFYRRISFAAGGEELEALGSELRDRFGILPKTAAQLLRFFRCKLRFKKLAVKALRRRDNGEQAVIEPWGWSDDLKLAWVLAHPKELAFQGETHIALHAPRIWDLAHGGREEQQPYTKYSYYNGDARPDPLDVLETLAGFMEATLAVAKSALASTTSSLTST